MTALSPTYHSAPASKGMRRTVRALLARIRALYLAFGYTPRETTAQTNLRGEILRGLMGRESGQSILVRLTPKSKHKPITRRHCSTCNTRTQHRDGDCLEHAIATCVSCGKKTPHRRGNCLTHERRLCYDCKQTTAHRRDGGRCLEHTLKWCDLCWREAPTRNNRCLKNHY